MLLARRFTLNPVLIILALVFWFWMWGVPGAILAVPMLAILKIVCDRLRPLKALGTSSKANCGFAPRVHIQHRVHPISHPCTSTACSVCLPWPGLSR
jgi:hypothetical protein